MEPPPNVSEHVDPDQLRIVLVNPRNPLNIGAAARAISNFGFHHLRLVAPYEIAYQEARSAPNAGEILRNTREYTTLADAIADCTLVVGTTSLGHRELQHPLRRLEAAGETLRQHLTGAPLALVFGSEKFGLSNEDLAYCHWLVRIGTREEHGSMNLGQAVAVCLYELRRQPPGAKPEERRPAASAEVERVTNLLLEVLEQSGYVHSDSVEGKTRRLVRRMQLQGHDAEVWLGMLRQIRWKVAGKPE